MNEAMNRRPTRTQRRWFEMGSKPARASPIPGTETLELLTQPSRSERLRQHIAIRRKVKRRNLATQSSRTVADDNFPCFSPQLDTVALLMLPSTSSILTDVTPGHAKREPLSLTERRRE